MDLPNNLWKSPVIQKHLLSEAVFEGAMGFSHNNHYWFLAPQADTRYGDVELKNFMPSLVDVAPHELQQDFARGLRKFMQEEIGFDGLWLVGWTHPPTSYGVLTDTTNCWGRLVVTWLDGDGDPQISFDSEFPFATMVGNGIEYYAGLGQQAYQQWKEQYSSSALKSDMALSEGQTKKAALEALK